MKMKLLAMCLACASMQTTAQNTDTSSFRLSKVSFLLGTALHSKLADENYSTFQRLNPPEKFRNLDLTGYDQIGDNQFGVNSSLALDVQLHFVKTQRSKNAKKLNLEYKIGLSYVPLSIYDLHYSRRDKFRIDTLISSSTQQHYYVDSIHNINYTFRHQQDLIYATLGATISSNEQKRWGFSIGAEAAVGYSISTQTNFEYYTFSYSEGSNDLYIVEDDFEHESEYETVKNKSTFSLRLGLPIGLYYRISKNAKTKLFRSQVFVQSRPNLTYIDVPNIGASVIPSNILSLGYQYEF